MHHIILNPNAKSGRGPDIRELLTTNLSALDIPFKMHFTTGPESGTRLARELTKNEEASTLVVVGGDGSLNEVINGIEHLASTTLIYIPAGSGNDFARGMRIPAHPAEAINQLLVSKNHRKINLGYTVTENGKRRFAVSSGLGYDASICHQASQSLRKKILNYFGMGKMIYLFLSLEQLIKAPAADFTLLLDGNKKATFHKAYFAAAHNLPYEGGGCKFCPSAIPDDDYLNLIIVSGISKARAFLLLPFVLFGAHTHKAGVHIFRCKKAEVFSDTSLAVHTDGEPFSFSNQIQFHLENEKLSIRIP